MASEDDGKTVADADAEAAYFRFLDNGLVHDTSESDPLEHQLQAEFEERLAATGEVRLPF